MKNLLRDLDREYEAAWDGWKHPAPSPRAALGSYPTGKRIHSMSPYEKADLVRYLFERHLRDSSTVYSAGEYPRDTLASQLMKDPLPISGEELASVIRQLIDQRGWVLDAVRKGLLVQARALLPHAELQRALEFWHKKVYACHIPYESSSYRRDRLALEAVIQGIPETWLTPTTPWLLELEKALGSAAYTLVSGARSAEPRAKWRKEVAALGPIPIENAAEVILATLRRADSPIDPDHSDPIRGVVWLLAEDPPLIGLLGEIATESGKKIPMYGAKCQKGFNAAVTTLGRIGTPEALAELARLRPRTQGRNQASVLQELESAAKRENVSLDELEELIVPTFGLGAGGTKRVTTEGGELVLSVRNGNASLDFVRSDGRFTKSLPKTDEAADLKKVAKEIRFALTTQLWDQKEQRRLVGEWAKALPSLTHVRRVDFRCRFPNALLEPLSRMAWLEALHIKWSGLRSIRPLENLGNLQEFHLGSSPSLADPEVVLQMANLRKLSFENVRALNDISWISNLTQIEELRLDGSMWTTQKIKSLEPLKFHHRLERLSLISAKVREPDTLMVLAQMPNLKVFEAAWYWPKGALRRLVEARPDLWVNGQRGPDWQDLDERPGIQINIVDRP